MRSPIERERQRQRAGTCDSAFIGMEGKGLRFLELTLYWPIQNIKQELEVQEEKKKKNKWPKWSVIKIN